MAKRKGNYRIKSDNGVRDTEGDNTTKEQGEHSDMDEKDIKEKKRKR